MLGLVDADADAEPAEEASGHETVACEEEEEGDDDNPLQFLHTRLPRIPIAMR